MKKSYLILIYLFIIKISYSQRGYIEGYVLKGNDTIKGKIKDNSFFMNKTKKILFLSADGKKQKLSSKQIKGYGKLGLLHYHSIYIGLFGGTPRFATVLESGNLILYSYTTTYHTTSGGYGGSGFGGYSTMGSTSQSTNYYIQQKNNNKTERVPFIGFKSFITKYVDDDTELKKDIEDKSLRYNDILLIVKKYNDDKLKK